MPEFKLKKYAASKKRPREITVSPAAENRADSSLNAFAISAFTALRLFAGCPAVCCTAVVFYGNVLLSPLYFLIIIGTDSI